MQPPHPPPYAQPYAAYPPAQPMPPQSPGTAPPTPRSLSVMDALRFTSSGHSGWTNILLCALLYLSTQIIPIVGLIVMQGFFAEIQRRLVSRHPDPYLRFDFSDLGSYLSRGIAPFVVTFLVALPFTLLFVAMVVAIAVATSAGLLSDLPGVRYGALFVGFGGATLLFFPLALLCIALLNAATTRAEIVGDVSKAFNVSAIWSYAAKTWKQALLTTFLMSLVGAGLILLGLLACFIGTLVSASILYIAGVHVRWQIYNEYLLEGGEPIELAPWEPLPSEARKAPQYAPAYAVPPVR